MESASWTYSQKNSDKILSDGVLKLKSKNLCRPLEVANSGFGNYLISHGDILYYIGEAKNLERRIKQQFKPTTSTFYKNFEKYANKNQDLKSISIEDFSVQFMLSDIGRKEVEDFGISNLSILLNRFQLGKRQKIELENHEGLWDIIQTQKGEILSQGERLILNQKPTPWFNVNSDSTAGLYIVFYNKEIIYIGESSDIKIRYSTHSGVTYFSALRRHIGTEMLGCKLQERNGKRKYFEDVDDKRVTHFLTQATAIFYPVSFGRYELEEYLIKKYKPLLNRKDNEKTD